MDMFGDVSSKMRVITFKNVEKCVTIKANWNQMVLYILYNKFMKSISLKSTNNTWKMSMEWSKNLAFCNIFPFDLILGVRFFGIALNWFELPPNGLHVCVFSLSLADKRSEYSSIFIVILFMTFYVQHIFCFVVVLFLSRRLLFLVFFLSAFEIYPHFYWHAR